MKYLSQMINRARSINKQEVFGELDSYGLSTGEKIHMNIIEKLFTLRIESLNSQKEKLKSVVRGGRQ
jgi:hypothetical protein